MFKCRLKIESRYKKLSLEDGLSLKEVGEIFSKLAKCLEDKDNIKFTLVGVDNTSYTPVIETDELKGVEIFKKIHLDISKKSFDELTNEEQDYASSLNTLLFEKGIYLKAINDNDKEEIEISSISKPGIRNYSSITTITGTIVSIVGKNEKNPYITVTTSFGKDYKIFIKKEQEKELSHFYKEAVLRLRIKQKIDSWTNKELDSILFDFEKPDSRNFFDSVIKTKEEYGDIFLHIKDSATLIRELRNAPPND